MKSSLPILLAALLLSAACGAAKPRTAVPAPLTVERLYPMRKGSVWTYDVDIGEGPPILAITRVTASEGSLAEVTTGSQTIRYERKPDGLYRPDRDAFVLKTPLRAGERWAVGDGASAEVSAVDKLVSTPAGDFRGCVEVLETGGSAGKTVRTVFCPDVGPVEVESTLELTVTKQRARVLARLRGYDFAGALEP